MNLGKKSNMQGTTIRQAMLAFVWMALMWPAGAFATTLDEVSFAKLPGDRVQIKLSLSAPVDEPLSFAIDNPARVALDFPGVKLNLDSKRQDINVGMARSVAAVEAAGRTRVVLNLVQLVPYELRTEGNAVYITLDSPGAAGAAAFRDETGLTGKTRNLSNIDFRRGQTGEARIIVTLSDPSTVVDTREEGSEVIIDFFDTTVPEHLQRRLDVVDFATPVQTVDTFPQGSDSRIVIGTEGLVDILAYQSSNLFTLEVRRLTEREQLELKKDKFGYTGERLSLNFQNIEVRAVLQLIADFTGKNLVASDTVSGNLTLRLKNVPWDQALDIILRSKGLALGDPSGALKFALISIPDFLLQLELQALQTEGRGEVLANPRVVTSNQKEALIEAGTEIPFQEASSSGATTVSFKPAVLSLRVTPQITPDDRVIMDLQINQDTVGQEFSGIPSVDTQALSTQVLVDNGDTVVLGGIFNQTNTKDVEKVPFFGDLPYLGLFFRTEAVRDEKNELLIFVTPKIIKESFDL